MADEKKIAEELQSSDTEARREAARLMGQASTEAKVKAAQENGKLGGRPKGTPVSEETRRKLSEAKKRRDAERKAQQEDDTK